MIKKFLLFFVVPVLLSFSYPPVNQGVFFIIGYVLFLYLLKDIKQNRIIKIFIVFFVFFFLLLQWILFININFTIIQRILIFLGYIILCSALSFVWTFPFFFIKVKNNTIYLLPIFFAAIEFLSSIENNTAFLWYSPSYAMVNYLYFIQMADIGGMFLISFFIIMISVLIFKTIISKGKKRYIQLGILIFLVLLNLLYGIYSMNKDYGYKDFTITIVQPNLPAIAKVNYYKFSNHRKRLIKSLLQEARTIEQDLIVFPETSSPVYLQRNSAFTKYIINYSKEYNKSIIMGSLRLNYIKEKGGFEYFNSAFFIDKGELKTYYDKIRPLGFAERIPFDDKFVFLRKIPLGQGEFSPGREYKLFNIKDTKFAVYICFESVFSTIPLEFTKRGAEFLVNISEDIWFKNNVGPIQHFQAGIIRSVENRRYLVRVSNPGISAIINPKGNILKEIELYKQGIETHNIKLCKVLTFYTKYDNIIAKLFLIIMTIYIIYALTKRRIYVRNKS